MQGKTNQFLLSLGGGGTKTELSRDDFCGGVGQRVEWGQNGRDVSRI